MKPIFHWGILFALPFLSDCRNVAASPAVTLKILSYNVMRYGDGCPGSNATMHQYLKTIVHYTQPDVAGLVKVEAIPQAAGGEGMAPVGFADSILEYAFNAAFAARYAYCPFTNKAKGKDQPLLFYNKSKLGFCSVTILVSDITDFNLYKLYYLDPDLAKKHDSAFLYVVLIHTESGDKSDDRDRQLEELMAAIRKLFPALPEMVIMGDFNLHKTKEPGYEALTQNAEKSYRFADPPFSIDKQFSYPGNWDKDPEKFSKFLTTSTRKKKNEPDDCGTGGGAKGWYDHILLAPSLAAGNKRFYYIPGTFRVTGNDGNRINTSVNDKPNVSAPQDVLDALFHFSNKYPVMLELGVTK